MLNGLLTSAPLPHEAQRCSEDAFPPLPRLHGPGNEALPVAHPLDMIEDGYRRVAGEDEVAVHAVNQEFRVGGRYSGLRGGEALGYHCTPIYPSGTGRMPQFAGGSQRMGWR